MKAHQAITILLFAELHCLQHLPKQYLVANREKLRGTIEGKEARIMKKKLSNQDYFKLG